MSFWRRLGEAWGMLWSGEGEDTSKALDPKAEKLLRSRGVDTRARGLDPFRPLIEPGGFGPRKTVGVPYFTLRAFARSNPWLRAVVDIRKREVASADWDIVPDLDYYQRELDDLQRLIQSAVRYDDRKDLLDNFKPNYIDPKQVKALIEATSNPDLTPSEIRHRCSLGLSDRKREAERHAAQVRKLFKHPHRDMGWAQILRAVVPDLLVLDSMCLEKRRTARPKDESGLPLPNNPILELHPVDGATVRPCIDEFGMLREDQDENQFAYEQWIQGMRVDGGGWRRSDLLRVVENPQTDIEFRGYGFSRVESLVMTSILEGFADKEDLEEFKRGMHGVMLHIKDKAWQQEDVDMMRDYIEEELEGTKKIGILAMEDAQVLNMAPHGGGRDKKSTEKLKRYVLRICALFEMPPVKVAQYENANYSTSDTGQDMDDDGLRSLLDFLDNAITQGVVRDFGHTDIKYTSRPDHNRDREDDLKNYREELELGLATVNEVRMQDGRDPAEWGDKPYAEFKTYHEEKGRAEGGGMGGEEGEEGEPELDEDGNPIEQEGSPDNPHDASQMSDSAIDGMLDQMGDQGGNGVEKAIALEVHQGLVQWRQANPHGTPEVTVEVLP